MTFQVTDPHFENGRFIPSYPERIKGDALNVFQQLSVVRRISRNPLAGLSERGFHQPVVQANFLGQHLTQVSDPAMIRHCLIDNRDNYRMSFLRQALFKPFLRGGLLTAEGETWRHARRTLAPIFTPKSIAHFADGMRRSIERDLPDFVQDGDIVDMTRVTSSLTYLVLSDALFSGEITGARSDILEMIRDVLKVLGQPHLFDMLALPEAVPRLRRGNGPQQIKRLRALIRTVAEDRLHRKAEGKALPEDFLTRMIGAPGEEAPFTLEGIEDQMMTFIGAGHETTAQALTWMFYLLSEDEAARAQAEAEVDALDVTRPPVEWAEALPFTMACFKEALRLYPPAAAISRQANAPDRFGEYEIPKDGVWIVQLFALHRHHTLWDAPDSFMPERFLGAAGERINKYQYLPFGVGHRVCIGERFAMVEAGILIASLMRQFRFAFVGDKPPSPTIRLSLQPEERVKMQVSLR